MQACDVCAMAAPRFAGIMVVVIRSVKTKDPFQIAGVHCSKQVEDSLFILCLLCHAALTILQISCVTQLRDQGGLMQWETATTMIRHAETDDCAALARIYNHYVANTTITFEELAVTADDMAARVSEAASSSLPFLVALSDDEVVGLAFATKWKGRCAYRFTAEISVYVDVARRGQGVGSRLYDSLFPLLQARGVHVVIGGIALPNEESVRLHQKFGLKKVAHFSEVGFKFGRWIDVGYWQRIFDQMPRTEFTSAPTQGG